MSEISNDRELNLVAESSLQTSRGQSNTHGMSVQYFWETISGKDTGDTRKELRQSGPLKATYVGVLMFCFFYFFRAEDLLPAPLATFPFEKIAGVLTGVSLIAAIASRRIRFIAEIKLILLLFGYLCLSIPGSLWPGGSFDLVVNVFTKSVLIVIAAMCAFTTVERLRRVILVQIFAMLTLALLALNHDRYMGRMLGVGKMFGDPNDFALNLCVVLPLCVAMLLSRRSLSWRLFWTGASGLTLVTILSTYSRGGFLTLVVVAIAMWRLFRFKTLAVVLLAIVCAITLGLFDLGSSSYIDRIKTITDPQADGTGSAQARRQLFARSIEITLEHPFLGVGPGQFAQISGNWHETHNSYTQLSSEAGVPALLIFLALIWRTFKNLRKARESEQGTEASLLARGLYCAFVGYLVGAFFLSTAFSLIPYLLVAYASALARASTGKGDFKSEPTFQDSND